MSSATNPGPPSAGLARPGAARGWAALGLAVSLAVAAAVYRQDFGGALPLGLFNDGRAAYAWASRACLAAALALAAVFLHEWARGRPTRVAGTARRLLAAAVLVELTVTAVDVLWVSSPRGAGFGGPYREATSRAGTRVFLKRPHPGSPLGFRSEMPHAKVPGRRRVLFLGDSYTEGSGRDFACNYPEVAGAVLAERLGEGIDVMNAGVAGYGPADALALLRFLAEEGYRFDVVVLGLFLENDFTDNLPGTERRVVAGINFRFPSSAWLRRLHPMNSRAFRYGVFGVQARRLRGLRDDFASRGDGRCRPPPPLAEPLPASLRELVMRRLETNYAIPARPVATGVVAASLAAIRDEAAALGVPLVLVVFPDRVLADAELRERLALDPGVGPEVSDLARAYDLGRLRRWVAEHARGVPTVDVTAALSARPGLYRPSDTHLSDPGNVEAGRAVGEALAGLLDREPPG